MFVWKIWDSHLNEFYECRRGNSSWFSIGGAKQTISKIKRDSKIFSIVNGKKQWIDDFDDSRYIIQKFELVWKENIEYKPKV